MQNRRNAIYVLVIFTAITGLFTGRAFFFNVAYMLGAVLVVSIIWAWTSVRWVTILRRTRSRRTQVGRTFDETFVVTNRSWLPKLWIEVRDMSNLPGHRASYVVPTLGAAGSYDWQVRTRCTVRGEFKLGPMQVVSGDPFGFFVTQRRIEATSRIVVYPQMVSLNNVDLPMGMLSGGEAQRRRSHYITTNASGVRDYVSGDSFNRIHWRSSARKDRLIVKEFEIDPLVDLWLFADFSRHGLIEDPTIRRMNNGHGPVISSTVGIIPPSTEEYVAVITASLARYFIELERVLGFAAYTPNRDVHQPERGSRQLTHILESLAVARSLSDYTLGQMLSLETPYFTRGTTLVIVTASTDPDWVMRAQVLLRRGIRPLCVYVDPETFGAASGPSIKGMLRLARIPTIVVKRGDDLASVLSKRVELV